MAIVRAVSARLLAMGIDQWDEVYPNRRVLSRDVEAQSLYVVEDDGVVQAMMALNEVQDKEYVDVRWLLPDARALVVHRLCVDPAFQGRGLARQLMAFAEDYARCNGYASIRLDTFSKNPISQSLYASLGYTQCGSVTFLKGLFYCFEKDVTCEPLQ